MPSSAPPGWAAAGPTTPAGTAGSRPRALGRPGPPASCLLDRSLCGYAPRTALRNDAALQTALDKSPPAPARPWMLQPGAGRTDERPSPQRGAMARAAGTVRAPPQKAIVDDGPPNRDNRSRWPTRTA